MNSNNTKGFDREIDEFNICLATDSYKLTHHLLLPDDLIENESYGEARGGEYEYNLYTGMTYYLVKYLQGKVVTKEKIEFAKKFAAQHFGNDYIFESEPWEYIIEKYDGKLPITIYSLKEGTLVKTGRALFKIKCNDPKVLFLTNYIETLLQKLWYSITVATNSFYGRLIIEKHARKSISKDIIATGLTKFLLHDFGYRGVATEEQAKIGGFAHLLSFMGTDTTAGILFSQDYYNAGMVGFSVIASEHMVMTIKGRDKEVETYKRILRKCGKGTKFENMILSLVSDTYNVYDIIKTLLTDEEAYSLIMERPGKFVFRLDSGTPEEVIINCLNIIDELVGTTTNELGFKVIPEKFGLLQGDGITIKTMDHIINCVENAGYSLQNLVFGSGGGLLQAFNRDTIKFAIKSCYAKYADGTEVDVYKDPFTAGGSKTSKKGKQYTIYDSETDELITINHHKMKELKYNAEELDQMELVFSYGDVLVRPTFDEIRERVENNLNYLLNKE